MSIAFDLPEKKRLLLKKLLGREGVPAQPRIPRRTVGQPARLSFGQERLWFLHQLDPASAAYNVHQAMRLTGALDPHVLASALEEIVRRHEVLRTKIVTIDGQPAQVVAEGPSEPLLLIDVSAVPAPLGTSEAGRLAEQLIHAPFVLEEGVLLRAALIRLDADNHVLVLVVHHIACDGWSINILLRELTTLYAAFAAGRPSPWPNLPIQYADFAEWQRERLQGGLLESQLSYWKGQLAGADVLINLPADRPWPVVSSFRGRREMILVPQSAIAALRSFAQSQGATLFMTALAALGVLLHRYTNQDDLLVGSPVTNRRQPETEGLIGFLVNTVALRIGLAGEPAFPDLLARVRDTVLAADAHQDLPFEKLVDALELPRDLARTPLFQVMLAFQSLPPDEGRPGGLALTPFDVPSHRAQFELLFSLTDGGQWLGGFLDYRTELFEAATARRIARHFEALLDEIAHEPQRRISDLPVLTEAERHHLVWEWNDAARAYSETICLHRLIEAQAARTPNTPAATFEGRSLTYADLNSQANALARRLRALGCGPDERVGIVMERSLELVVALLATLKTGAAYVPIDPEYPRPRIELMLADSRPRVLLTQDRLREGMSGHPGPVICLNPESLRGESAEDLPEPLDDRLLAYMIYTSGSTGRPKGAMVHHRGICNRLLWMQETYSLDATDTVLQKTPYSFDVSVWEFFLPLLAGARLVLARPGGHREGAYLAELIERENITVLHFVPSMLQVFLEEPAVAAGRCRSLRLVVCSGEALPPELERRFSERLGAVLENLYGPTEASVDVTSWTCSSAGERRSVPIGRPIANTRIHLLDLYGRPAPLGVTGELVIGGRNVGRGYLDRPALTAERFVPDPFGEPGARLYRTGDLARHLPDGAIEFLGRIDHQVKIRGFRIELGEIEYALTQHGTVREVIVVASGPREAQRLVAYVVPLEGATVNPGELRGWVQERLPEYMVPSVVVILDALPLLANGKVDRRALPVPDAPAEVTAPYVAPRNAREQAIARIWAALLAVERVGIHDDYFSLGGDSIQAVRLASRINQELSADLRVQDVFKHPTIAGLAAQVGGASARATLEQELAAGRQQIERLREGVLADPRQRARLPRDYEDVYPLSGVESGMMYYSLLLPDEPIYIDQYVYLVELREPARFFRAFDLLVGRHPIFRSAYHLYSFDQPLKVVLREARTPREIEDLRELPEAEQRRRILEYRRRDLENHFTFDGDLPWRLKLFRVRDEVHALVWTYYHALLDGWSNHSFWAELNDLYSREDLDELTALPRLESDYKDYVAVSLGRRGSAETASFWRQLLAGYGRNKLPFNRSKVREAAASGMRRLDLVLPGELLDELRLFAREHSVSLRTVCLAAHVYLLHVTAAEDDVLTGVVSHDRPALKDSDKVLGCFLTSVPIRIDMTTVDSGLTLVRRVHGLLSETREHEMLLADIAATVGAKEAADNPFFDTLFNYMNFHVVERIRDNNHIFSPMASASLAPRYQFRAEEMTNTRYDLEVSATLGNFSVRLKYSPRHFEEEDIRRSLLLYRRTLEAFIRGVGARLSPEALLSPAERSALVYELNDTAFPYPREVPLHRLFEQQARQRPDQPAVTCRGRSLTYRELDEQANRTARHLLACGVAPGQNVGVIFERSVDLVAALLAVLKCGAAYVPLEPDYPAARKAYILATSGASCVLADREHELPAGARPVRWVIPAAETLAAYQASPLSIGQDPNDLAYTIYTSGSTGNPKGVMIEHHSAVNLVQWVNRRFAVDGSTTILMLSSVCFDLSVYDVFGGLGAGARMVIALSEDLRDPARLMRVVERERITFWSSVPSTMSHLVNYLEQVAPSFRQPDLKLVFLSGDWIPLALPARIRTYFPNAQVVSLGGATEATVWSNLYPVDGIDEAWASIPYGRPIDNTSFYILDKDLRIVPPGVVGDLYIGGVGVARGYAGEPEKTARSFVPDPFAAGSMRMYRTGDLGRMMVDGNIEFLGRADHQVKIRGFRVELGEIESQLLTHPGVRDAVVVDRMGPAGEKFLCAYVVAGTPLDTADLRHHLASALPEYMIPATFIELPQLPLTANGKVDRKALPEPGMENIATAAEFVAAESEVEAGLVAIWEEVLGVGGIGTRHDFFELGGHSLSAVQVVTRIRRRFGFDLPLREVFQHPVLADLARVVEEERSGARGPELPPITPRPAHEETPLSFSQQRLWFMDQLEPGNPFYNIFSAVRVEGSLDLAVLRRALGEIVRRHEVLRTVFVAGMGGAAQQILPPALPALPVIDLEMVPGGDRDRQVRALLARALATSFDLSRGPLLQCQVLRLGDREHVFTLVMHHIVSDGWSSGILVRELVTLYESFLRGEPSPLPELPLQYADFAVWQQRWLQGQVYEEQISYWKKQLAGAPTLINLPTDRPRPPVQSFRGDRHDFNLPPELTEPLKSLSRDEDCTLFMTLLAAFQALLHYSSGDEDILIGAPISYRNWAEIEGMIGFFVNTLVYRTRFFGDPTFRELLARVRKTALEAFAHQHIPFEKLVEELRPTRSPSHQPLYQVNMVLQPSGTESYQGSELSLSALSFNVETTQFDLNLSMTDTPGGVRCQLQYSIDLFEKVTIAWMAGQLAYLLEQVAKRPELRISEIKALLAQWDKQHQSAARERVSQASLQSFQKRKRRLVAATVEG
ncbi:MAG TPA: amino acid adenylation domain-containing protein [Thermoanaerobaculia bacterium]